MLVKYEETSRELRIVHGVYILLDGRSDLANNTTTMITNL